ncbi:MAG TPA: 50S ribosomal protein L22 [Defluviitaleaceae bacterium]|nr:50S ribosomal protein L22 [Defluviitaleaceae bacterium]HPT75560.1 50S ribosomal protein L22 [Defluviitaleaceae bacterium]
MAKGHRSQIKRERNQNKDTRPKAHLRYARVSASKAKIVLDTIKGKNANEALAILAYTPRKAARIIEKLLKSAIANAENNHELDREKLFIEEAYANQGPKMKRIRPRAQGRAYRIDKQTSHISIVLNER